MSSRGRVLLVCTANRARSPMMELLLRDILSRRGETAVDIESAGTRTLDGEPVTRHTVEVLRGHGVDASAFRSRMLNAAQIRAADIVLCAERSHRAAVVRIVPTALPRTFSLAQAARLTEASVPSPDGSHDVAALVTRLALARGSQPSSELDDIADPAGGSIADYQHAFDRISRAVRVIGQALAP